MSLDQGMRYNSGFNYHNQYLPQDHYQGQLSGFQNELTGLNLNRLLNEVSEVPQQNQNFHSNDQFSSAFGTSDTFGSRYSNDLFGSKFSSSNGANPLQSLLEKNYPPTHGSHGTPESSFSSYSSWSTAGFQNQSSAKFSTQNPGSISSQGFSQNSSSFGFNEMSSYPDQSPHTAYPRPDYSTQFSNFSGSLISSQPSSKASSNNLLGLSDITSRLEGLSQGSMLMSQGSLSPKARGSRGSTPLSWGPTINLSSKTSSLTPSPILSLGAMAHIPASNSSVPRNLSSKLNSVSTPEDDFVFFSDDEDEKSGKPKTPKKQHTASTSAHDKMQTSIRGIAKLKVSKSTPNCSAQSVPSSPQPTSWSQIVRTSSTKLPSLSVSTSSGPVTRSNSGTPSPPMKGEPQLVTEELPPSTTSLDYHRGPKVDPRWPVAQQVFLGPIPMAISWDEIRNVFYTKVQRRELLHFYVQSKPVNDVVYGQVVFDKVSLANRILKEGPVKVRGHLINVTSMKEKLKQDKKKM